MTGVLYSPDPHRQRGVFEESSPIHALENGVNDKMRDKWGVEERTVVFYRYLA